LNPSNSFALNQAYHLTEISKKVLLVLPEFEAFVKKEPRPEFLVLTNKLQKSTISKIEKKNHFKPIDIVLDLI